MSRDEGRVRVNSSPADSFSAWTPHVHVTPSRLRAHLRPLDLARPSKPAAPRSASSYNTAFSLSKSLAALNITDSTSRTSIDLTDSPTKNSFDSPTTRKHAPTHAIHTPPLTPSSSFTSTTATDVDQDDPDDTLSACDRGAWIPNPDLPRWNVQVEGGKVMVARASDATTNAFFPSTLPSRAHDDGSNDIVVPDSPTPVRGCRLDLSAVSKSRPRSVSLSPTDYERGRVNNRDEDGSMLLFFDDDRQNEPPTSRPCSTSPRDVFFPPPPPPQYAYHYMPYAHIQHDPAYLSHPGRFDVLHGIVTDPARVFGSDGVGHEGLNDAMRQAYASIHAREQQGIPPAPDHSYRGNEDVFGAPHRQHLEAREPTTHWKPRPGRGRGVSDGPGLYHRRAGDSHAHSNSNLTSHSHASSSPPPPFTDPRHIPPEKNQLSVADIEAGLDTRTTVMIKNIPNKMCDMDLLRFLDRDGVARRKVDFFYLRMDFRNGCNVGYAFVNFITVQDLLHFAKTQLGVRWNMYSSEKVLQLSYADYQGKEALIEKFRNSAIMDERPAWRPRIFYSCGPREGLPEPFPEPTHLKRKERSAWNRGALFVPGGGKGRGR